MKRIIIIRKMPMLSIRIGGPTLLTLTKIGPSNTFKALSIVGKYVSINTMMMDPIMGPSIVPSPPIIDIIRGLNEFSGE